MGRWREGRGRAIVGSSARFGKLSNVLYAVVVNWTTLDPEPNPATSEFDSWELPTFDETRLGQGREAAKDFLKTNTDIAAEIERRIRGKIDEVALPVEGIEEAE